MILRDERRRRRRRSSRRRRRRRSRRSDYDVVNWMGSDMQCGSKNGMIVSWKKLQRKSAPDEGIIFV